MPDPLAFFLTWTTYGTWLPGDERGWVRHRLGHQPPDPVRKQIAATIQKEAPCILDPAQRQLVDGTIKAHCELRKWDLFAVNCRTNHVHVVVAADRSPAEVQSQFKAWCTRRLKERQREEEIQVRENWWTEGGSQRYLNDEKSLEAAVIYVRECQ